YFYNLTDFLNFIDLTEDGRRSLNRDYWFK
ncbi:unnamed protein product, partial [marine sediment metagenome]